MATGSDVNETQSCTEDLPTTAQLAKNMPLEGHILVSLLVLFSILTLLIYVDEIIFIRKRIRRGTRTMWVLACFPVFSSTSLLAVFIPRSGVVVDMVASGFFATCLYNFGRLMIRYMGGSGQLWKLFESGRKVSFRTVPVCCCCFCIPLVPFRMKVYNGIRALVMQVAIIRPILTFIAVVLYVDGNFKPGSITLQNPYTYVGICNIISTMSAVYGLMILRGIFQPELEQRFKLTGKIISVQLTLISSILPNVIINILVSTEVIGCSTLFPSKARGEMICHVVIVLIMLPLALLAQRFFRRSSDGDTYFDQKSNIASSSTSTHDQQQQQQLDQVDKHLPVAVTDAMDKNCTLIAMRPLSTDTDPGETNV